MDHVSRRQIPGSGNHRLAGGTPVRILLARLSHDVWPTTPMDGTINPTTTGQPAIGGVDDRVGILVRDIPSEQFERTRTDGGMHGHALILWPNSESKSLLTRF
jgi:hypothetical protein